MSTVNFVIVKPEISHADFVRLTAEKFPVIAEDIQDESYDSLIHLQVACLKRYANECLVANNLAEFERILRFVDYILPKVDGSLDNALHVSFVEDLLLDGDSPILQAAKKLLSPWQLEFYVAIRKWESEHTNWQWPT
jgi:hypothetical protein